MGFSILNIFHHDDIYFFSHDYLCLLPYVCIYVFRVVLSLFHHYKDNVIMQNSGVAKQIGGCK